MADDVSIKFGAKITDAVSEINKLQKTLKDAADTTRQTLSSFDSSSARASISDLGKGVDTLNQSAGKLNQTIRLNRVGMMELQAAGINSFQALASGMDVFRVSMMEGSQVLGALVQGGVIGLSSLVSPLGLMTTAGIAAAGAMGYLGLKAVETKNKIESLQTEMQITGRTPFSEQEVTAAADEIAKKWNLSKDSVLDAIKAIQKGSTALNKEQVIAATELAAKEAVASRQSIDETSKKYQRIVDSASAIAVLGKEFNLPGTDLERIARAGNAYQAIEGVLGRIREHLEAAVGAQARLNAEAGKSSLLGYETMFSRSWNEFKKMTGWGQTPGTTEDMLREHGLLGTRGTVRLGDPNSKLFGVDPELVKSLQEATRALPEGWRAEVTSGVRSGAHLGGGEHGADATGGHAVDVKLFDASGRVIPNPVGAAPNSTEYQAYKILGDAFIAAGGRRWGGNFTNTDIMHFGNNPDFPKGSGAGANAPEQAKMDEEKATRLLEAEFARREIAHRHSLESQLRDANDYHQKMLDKYGKDSREELDSATDVARKKAALSDQGLARQVADLRELQAASMDISRKIELQGRIIGTAQAGGAPITQIDQYRTELAGLQRQQIQENFRLSEQGTTSMRTARGDILRGFQAQGTQAVRQGNLSPLQALDEALAKSKELAEENSADLYKLYDAASSNVDRIRIYWSLWQEGVRAATEQQQLLAQRAQETKAIVEKWAQPIKSAFDQIGSSISSAVSSLITGKSTLRDALSSIGDTMVKGAVDVLGSTLSKTIARSLGAESGKGIGDFLSDKLSNSLSGALGGAAVAGGAAAGGGGLFGWLSSLFFFSQGGIVPSAAGGWSLPSFPGARPAMLHSREMVLPSHIASWVEQASNRGTGAGDTHMHLHAVVADGPAVARLFKENGRLITDAVRAGLRSNSLTPRTI